MRIFDHRNTSMPTQVCPICKTNDDKPTVLIPIVGTQEGNISQAEQFHVDCIDLSYHREEGIIAQVIK